MAKKKAAKAAPKPPVATTEKKPEDKKPLNPVLPEGFEMRYGLLRKKRQK